ncbi:MAG: Na+/H+ antiporter NhaA [Actinomycetota bacterium]|nr:Na+/H+ antiporter NhaA [Actinomycetota bacterium]
MTGATRLGEALRNDIVGGFILLVAAVIAVVWANTPAAETYEALRAVRIGPLDVEHWAADGALAVFFFVAGLELKQELTTGSLSRPADALVPTVAALAGMVVPAAIYTAVNLLAPTGSLAGWAVPMATDIAFALAVLSVVGRFLPTSLRAFLLTLAVVDDLGAITVIAVFFTSDVSLAYMALAVAGVLAYVLLQRQRVTSPLVYVPLVVATWWCTYESGIHATVAGVAFGLLTRAHADPGEQESPRDRLEHRLGPWSAGLAVPLFALFAAGVTLSGGLGILGDPVVLGIGLGLILGKAVGVVGGAFLATRFGSASLAPDLRWGDIAAVSVLAGIGFTVSLLITDLSFDGSEIDRAKAAVLGASTIGAVLGAFLVHRQGRHRQAQNPDG